MISSKLRPFLTSRRPFHPVQDRRHHQMERLEAENAALRARVAQLEAENARLRQENTTMTIPRTEAGRRLGSVVSAVSTGAAVAVAEADLDEDMPFANGVLLDLDTVGTELYLKAKTLMPQGCGLLSKRPESFLPDQWPSYYAKAQGPYVWDLSGNKYIDMCNAPVRGPIPGPS